jgi:hypothetical protein
VRRCSRETAATGEVAYENEVSSQTARSIAQPTGSSATALAVSTSRTVEIPRQFQATMERLVWEVGGLVKRLAREEGAATARAAARTRRAQRCNAPYDRSLKVSHWR